MSSFRQLSHRVAEVPGCELVTRVCPQPRRTNPIPIFLCDHAHIAGTPPIPPRVDFTWEGNDEGDHASGRGWAQLETDGSLRGHIFFHAGDDSGFRAILEEGSDRTS
ncbi:MAG: hypothetical protein LC808_27860 [Actinobacteria bacterium]|nr:hypothetical protein [Actinomycetota bacterium]